MKILLAIDASTCSEAAVQAVIAQLRPQNAAVRVVHAVTWEHIPISLQFARGTEAPHAYGELRERTLREAVDMVAGAARQPRIAGFSTSTVVQEGDPQQVVLRCAASWQPDLIVVGTHSRTGLDRLVQGSVSEKILRHATCSVEIVRVGDAPDRAQGPRAAAS
jgi:nucleotide-binding universal stress UspA family protein